MKRIWKKGEPPVIFGMESESIWKGAALIALVPVMVLILIFTIVRSAHDDVRRAEIFNALSLEERHIIAGGWLDRSGTYESSMMDYDTYEMVPKGWMETFSHFPNFFGDYPVLSPIVLVAIYLVLYSIYVSARYLWMRDKSYYLFSLHCSEKDRVFLFICLFVIWPAMLVSFVRMKFDTRAGPRIAAG